MSEQTVQLLDALDALPSGDKQTFVVEIMRRTRELPFDSGPLADEEIGEAGKVVFALLDQEENAALWRVPGRAPRGGSCPGCGIDNDQHGPGVCRACGGHVMLPSFQLFGHIVANPGVQL